jgi:hypothetical protein
MASNRGQKKEPFEIDELEINEETGGSRFVRVRSVTIDGKRVRAVPSNDAKLYPPMPYVSDASEYYERYIPHVPPLKLGSAGAKIYLLLTNDDRIFYLGITQNWDAVKKRVHQTKSTNYPGVPFWTKAIVLNDVNTLTEDIVVREMTMIHNTIIRGIAAGRIDDRRKFYTVLASGDRVELTLFTEYFRSIQTGQIQGEHVAVGINQNTISPDHRDRNKYNDQLNEGVDERRDRRTYVGEMNVCVAESRDSSGYPGQMNCGVEEGQNGSIYTGQRNSGVDAVSNIDSNSLQLIYYVISFAY